VHADANTNTSTNTSSGAESKEAARAKGFPKEGVKFYNLLLGFTSWTEKVTLTKDQSSDQSSANLLGNTITFELERYPVARWGYYLQGEALFGYANVGGSQTGVPYQLTNQSWFGTVVAVRGGYRVVKAAAFTAGAIVLYRKLELPSAGNTSVSSGSDFNYGVTVDLRIRVTNNWELRQEIGTLMVNASTFWSLGFGHKF
jgi:hypothetical protein